MTLVRARLYLAVKRLYRNKSNLFWTILFPLLMTALFIGVFAGNARPPSVKLGVVNLDVNSSVVRGLLKGLEESPTIAEIRYYGSVEELVEALRSPPPAPIDAGLVIPRGFTRNVTSGLQGTLIVYLVYTGGVWSNFTGYTLLSTLARLEDVFREHSVRLALRYVPAEAKRFIVSIAFPLNITVVRVKPPRLYSMGVLKAWYAVSVALIEALFIGLFTASSWLVGEARRGTLRYMLSTPARSYEYVIAVMLESLVGVTVATLVALGTGYAMGAVYSFDVGSWALFAVLVCLSTLFSASLGALIACFVQRPEAAAAAANAIGFPLMFIAGIVYPPWLLPGPLRAFAEAFPLSRLAEAARAVLVYGVGPAEALARYTPPQVLVATLVFIVLASMLYRRRLQSILEQGWAA